MWSSVFCSFIRLITFTDIKIFADQATQTFQTIIYFSFGNNRWVFSDSKQGFRFMPLGLVGVTNRLSLGLRKQARNENNKKYIYEIARMFQGSIKKGWTMGREFLQYKTHGKSQQNKRQALIKPSQHNLKI